MTGEQTEDILAGAEAREFGTAPPDAPEDTIDDFLSELETLEGDYDALAERIWDHVPTLAECDRPLGEIPVAIGVLRDYLTDRKKELES